MSLDLQFNISSLHEAYAAGTGPEEVVEACYQRIREVNDPGIFLHLIPLQALLENVRMLGPFDPAAKPLWGVPFAIKDNIDAAGIPTTAACPAFAYEATEDAFAVAALKAAGAILIGKTNLDQFATGLVGVRTPYPVPKNAVDPEIVPGGSSSGSGVAVAHGIVSFALGTDTAGSGRVPAALNNIVGLKPSLGAISNAGVVPACLSLDTLSIFALTVDDAYTVFRAAAVFNADDAYARPFAFPATGRAAPSFLVGVPDAASREFCGDHLHATAFDAALGEIEALGGKFTEIDFMPFFEIAKMLYGGVWVAERYTVIEDLLANNPQAVHPVTRQIVEVAKQFDAADTFRSFYRLQEFKRRLMPVIDGVDILCVPSIPTFFTVADLEADPIGPNSRLGTYTNFVNLLDLCGIAVPTTARADGRPGGVTLLARAGRDANVVAVAAKLHEACATSLGATAWALPSRPNASDAIDTHEIALAVVGAHMSGLPLNHELTRLGGRFIKTARTVDSYKLFSLPGGPPTRPGLVHAVDGAAVDIEVWALPAKNFGEFIQGVPRPLGIGTLVLDDMSEVKGFLCESYAVQHAEDVTRFGGWRAYLDHQSSQQMQNKESNHA
jgi:allophanate hydrolase